MLKTFDEWRAEGLYVLKGERACHKENGKYYFSENQVMSLADIKIAVQNRQRRLEGCKQKLIRDKEICKENNFDTSLRKSDVSYSKEYALSWLGYQGSSVYNEHCSVFDGMGISDALNEIF